ncbi:MAG: FecR domain-containing protein [Bacteroidota bacterium]
MEEQAFYKLLVERYVAKQLTDEELEVFVALASDGKLDEELALAMAEVLETDDDSTQRPGVYKLWPKIAVVAAAVAALALFIYFFNAPRHPEGSVATRDLLVHDIAPGRNGAQIMLGNGKVIELSGEKKGVVIGDTGMMYSDGSTDPSLSRSDISPSGGERSVMLTAQTDRGQTYEFILPDGTHVWLNAASSISFPSQFNGKVRKIVLDGEGYFEVAKDKMHPFIVASKGQEVEVLGTHFNINSYDEEPLVKTILVEGSVKVSQGEQTKILKPGQQAEQRAGQLVVSEANTAEDLAWKDGNFIFNGKNIKSIMRLLERWYNIEVVYEGRVTQELYYAHISRFKNISEILKSLENAQGVHFKIEGRRVTVRE